MPIEIRELVIRATVDPGEAAGCGPTSPPEAGAQAQSRAEPRSADDQVQICIREVLRILDEKRER